LRDVRFVPKAAVSRCKNGTQFDHVVRCAIIDTPSALDTDAPARERARVVEPVERDCDSKSGPRFQGPLVGR
jgi:hypothetical protein